MYLNRCIIEQFQLVRCLFQINSQWFSLGVFEISLFFVFLGMICSIHVSQYEESAFKQFCNPVLDLKRIIKSSAYKSEFSSVPFGRTNGSGMVFSN